MARRVNHEERKREIAERAVRLFSKVGYDNVSLIMIAAATGVSRTVLYRYFCDKREILDAAILTVTGRINKLCRDIIFAREGTTVDKLEKACHATVEVMFENKEFLVAVFDFVVARVRSGGDMNSAIAEFTSGTRNLLKLMISRGIRNGELTPILKVDRTTDALYSIFESCAMRIVLGTEKTSQGAKKRFSDAIHAISDWK